MKRSSTRNHTPRTTGDSLAGGAQRLRARSPQQHFEEQELGGGTQHRSSPKGERGGVLSQIFSGRFLTHQRVERHYPFVIYIFFLMFLYISQGYYVQSLHRQHKRLTAEIEELRVRSLTFASERMSATRRSAIVEALEEHGIELEESLTPPKIIEP